MKSHWSLLVLRISAVLTSLVAIFQATSGFGLGGFAAHPRTGELATVLLVVAAVGAYVWSRRSGNKGLFMHAAGMVVIGLIQIAIGHMDLREVHIAIGVLFLVGVVALATLAFRKPGTDGAVEGGRAVRVEG